MQITINQHPQWWFYWGHVIVIVDLWWVCLTFERKS